MKNLQYDIIVVGRRISTDQVVHSSCRMIPTCCAVGQAAGTATALAVEAGATNIRDMAPAEIRTILTADKVELDLHKHEAFAPHDTRLDKDDVAPRQGVRSTG
jgi:hypothetical protein